jgi:regulatory protein RepA
MKPPKLRWLFRDARTSKPFMRAGKCYVLSADGGVGKGFFTLQTAVSVATGRDLFGAFRPEQSGRVALLVGEDDLPEIHHRLHRIANALGLSDLEQVRNRIGIFPLSGQQVNLLRLDEGRNPERTLVFTTLLNQLTALAKQGDFEWSLISIDPLSRFGGSTVETDQNMATAFVAALEHLAEQLPGMPAVQVSHHSSAASVKSGRANVRGVSGLRDVPARAHP